MKSFKRLLGAVGVMASSLVGANTDTVVGTLPGDVTVTKSGAANYRIPIEVPPGVNGLQPNLALVYDSQKRNGLLGIGWKLTGFSSITRCPTTLSQDGFIDGVDFDDNDKFCLNGDRLVAINGGTYGAPGTEYRTEYASYRKIVSYGSAGNGPAYFKVWYKDNRIAEFGNTENAFVAAQGKSDALSWSINKIEDRFGNAINFNYAKNNATGEHYPASVSYAGATVNFSFEERPDLISGYVAGTKYLIDQRLKAVRITHNNQNKNYTVNYRTTQAPAKSIITSIQQCTTHCMKPTRFQWQGIYARNNFRNKHVLSGFGLNAGGWDANDHPRLLGDINGDGLDDVIGFANSGVFVGYSTGNGFTTTKVLDQFGKDSGWDINEHPRLLGDINGDGLKDIVGFASTGVSVAFSTGDGFTPARRVLTQFGQNTGWQVDEHPRLLSDINGDGRDDIVGFSSTGVHVAFSTGDGFTRAKRVLTQFGKNSGWQVDEHPRLLGDINGDGRNDIVGFSSTGVYVAYSTGDGFTAAKRVLPQFDQGAGWTVKDHPRLLGDVNGDGLDDIIGFASSGVFVAYSTGNGFTRASRVLSQFGKHAGNWDTQDHPRTLGDVNGDGLIDIIAFGSSGTYVGYSTGRGFVTEKVLSQFGSTSGWSAFEHPRKLGDANGDGLADIVAFGAKGTYFSHNTNQQHRLTQIANGLGHVTKLTYKPLTDRSVFRKSTGSVYPVKDVQPATYVVSTLQKGNGIGGFTTTHYRYAGLKFHQQGLGSLGFANVTSTQVETGIRTINEYAQDAVTHKIGVLTRSRTLAKSGVVLKDTQPYWRILRLNDGDIPRYQTLLASSTAVQRSLLGNQLSETTQQLTYDAFGNVTESQSTTTDIYGSYEHTVNTHYDNDETQWLIGLATRTEDTRSTPFAPSQTRTHAFRFDGTTGVLLEQTIEPDNGDLMLSTQFFYDGLGNPTVTRQTGAGIKAAITRLTYTDDGRFLKTSTNALGHTTSQTVDPFWGVMLTNTDANGKVTRYQYDSFGRLKKEVRHDRTETVVTRGASKIVALPKAKYWVKTQSSGSSPSITYFDQLGRSVRTETIALTGKTTWVDTQYNALGQIQRQSFPYFKTDTTQHWTTYQYDELLRPVNVTRPDGSVSSTAYNGLNTVVTNALGQTKITRHNALGQVMAVVDTTQTSLRYQYDAFGNLIQTTDPAGNVTTIEYDRRGRKVAMDDPDKGRWVYGYDALDRLTRQQDAKGQVSTLHYDKLNRLVKRIDNAQKAQRDWEISLWEYDKAYKGLLDKVSSQYFSREYGYDSLLRLVRSTQRSYNESFNVITRYDQYSRPVKTIYPTGLTVAQQYNAHGYLTAITDGQTQRPKKYWEAKAVDPFGNVSESVLGNGAATMRVVNPTTGRIETIFTSMSSANLSDLNFQYDKLGNLTSREDKQLQVKETFAYDQLNRLTDVLTTIGDETETAKVEYDAIGNITFKSDVGSYGYGGSCNGNTAGPHAVTQTTGSQNTKYCYDKNGNMVSGNQRTVQYTAFDKPDLINNLKNGASTAFAYGADRARHRRVDTTSTGTNTTYYMGGIYEKVVSSSGKVQHKHYIADMAIVTQTENAGSDNGTKTHYLHRDHLDSIVFITDETAQEVERFSYDPWGKKRLTDWKAAPDYTALASNITTRGFTNHENLDAVGLIHMNGRVYDPNLGKFLSADPFVQAPYNLQSYNRYSYAWNNPLNGTDPSGFTLIGGAVGDYETDYNDMADDNRNSNNSNDRSSGNRDSGSNYNSLDDRIGIDFDRVFESKGPTQTEINHHVDNAGGYNDDVSDYASVNGNHGGVLSDKPRNVISINPDDFDEWAYKQLAKKTGLPVDTVTKTGLITGSWRSIVKGFSRLVNKAKSLVSSLTTSPAKSLPGVPGRVKTRINLKKTGWQHILDRHFNPKKNASQFTISPNELKSLLQSKNVVNTPITKTLQSADGTRYAREVNVGKNIGLDKFSDMQPTSTMTVLSDRYGNIVTATPGVIK